LAYSVPAAFGHLARLGAFEAKQADVFSEKTREEEVIWNWCAGTGV